MQTLCVIPRWFVINLKVWARWVPEWWPGMRWKPTRSAQSSRTRWRPELVWTSFTSTQWAVTAIYGVKFGSDHMSVVNDSFPIEPYLNSICCRILICFYNTYGHFILQPIKMFIPYLQNMIMYLCSMWNIQVLQVFTEHKKNGLKLRVPDNVNGLP